MSNNFESNNEEEKIGQIIVPMSNFSTPPKYDGSAELPMPDTGVGEDNGNSRILRKRKT